MTDIMDKWMFAIHDPGTETLHVMQWDGSWGPPESPKYEVHDSKRTMMLRGLRSMAMWSRADQAKWDVLVFPRHLWFDLSAQYKSEEAVAE